MLRAAAKRLTAFFRAESHPVNLAVVRLVVFGQVFERLLNDLYERAAARPPELFDPPPGYDLLISALPADLSWVVPVHAIAIGAALLAFVGLWTRRSAAVACLGATLVMGIPESFGKVNHTMHHLIWFAALLAAGRSGDALSLDAWRTRRAHRGDPAWRRPGPAAAYGMPLRFMWLLLGVLYFFPGLRKLQAGTAWIWGEQCRYILWESWLREGMDPVVRIDRFPLLMRLLGASTIAFEMGFLVLILFRRTRIAAVVAGLAFHGFIKLFLNISFSTLVLCYVAFVDWHRVARFLRAKVRLLPASRPAASVPGPGSAPAVVAVGTFLLAGNLAFGFTGTDSWPLSQYPTFARLREGPRAQDLVVTLERPGEPPRELSFGLRSTAIRRIARIEDPATRTRKLRGLRALLLQEGLEPRPGDEVAFYDVVRSTVPGERDRAPLERTLLLRLPLVDPRPAR